MDVLDSHDFISHLVDRIFLFFIFLIATETFSIDEEDFLIRRAFKSHWPKLKLACAANCSFTYRYVWFFLSHKLDK
jgi:hypothetical protein